MIHYLFNKRRGETSYATIKLDMSKAYDRVEWSFLEDMMSKMGFHRRWIELILNCVTSVNYRIKVNGVLTDDMSNALDLRSYKKGSSSE